MTKTEYAKYLQSPRWKELRAEAIGWVTFCPICACLDASDPSLSFKLQAWNPSRSERMATTVLRVIHQILAESLDPREIPF